MKFMVSKHWRFRDDTFITQYDELTKSKLHQRDARGNLKLLFPFILERRSCWNKHQYTTAINLPVWIWGIPEWKWRFIAVNYRYGMQWPFEMIVSKTLLNNQRVNIDNKIPLKSLYTWACNSANAWAEFWAVIISYSI